MEKTGKAIRWSRNRFCCLRVQQTKAQKPMIKQTALNLLSQVQFVKNQKQKFKIQKSQIRRAKMVVGVEALVSCY